ncbi:GNAT family N-acetyltransferase [Herbaspirillum sp. alder98]|uniref:GNAT family N-acetyltransferase n=1 Tax=Herbaspirillum sp. alder98 TaxID=2913096 RepID=UPI001CD81BA3|nr:GNAT family N-acetyltransferase [Herbaspirillum sp. alder98]MCA1326292.1 GNAT family N-acetyltransferase [Herbaspirillum sp. alder98]
MIKIRHARAEDATTLYRAEHATSQKPGLLISHPEELSEDSFHEKLLWLNEAGIYVVAEIDGVPAGHASLEPGALRAMAHVFSLTIVVHPGHTGRGIGTALMESLLAWADKHPAVEKIELRVREGNLVAQRLYARFGFVEEGRFAKRIRLADGTYLADIAMAKLLTT